MGWWSLAWSAEANGGTARLRDSKRGLEGCRFKRGCVLSCVEVPNRKVYFNDDQGAQGVD